MADFVKKHKRNVRFSVNRNKSIFLKVSQFEKDLCLELIKVLQQRRNSGSGIDTVMYLIRKYSKDHTFKSERQGWASVNRDKGIFIKMSESEKQEWLDFVGDNSQVETFMYMVNEEYHFQDSVKIIMTK